MVSTNPTLELEKFLRESYRILLCSGRAGD